MNPAQLSLQQRAERQAKALMVLARRWPTYEGEPANATRAIIQSAAVALDVERASVWRLADGDRALICNDLYEASRHRHSSGFKMSEDDYPAYFAALQGEGWIIAADARQDPRTAGLVGSYLEPHGIGALMDLPIRSGGAITGVLRTEHVGGPRVFQTDEQMVASHLAGLASLAAELADRRASDARLACGQSILDAGLEAAGSALLLLDNGGAVVYHNQRLLDMWQLDPALMGPAGDNGRRIEQIAAQTRDPARFIARYRRISADEKHPSTDTVELLDGRVIERSSAPQCVADKVVGRAWSFRETGRR